MQHALMMYLRLRRLNGRTIRVSRGGMGCFVIQQASATLAGIGGFALDGDASFVPWRHVEYVQWGVATDRIVAGRLAELAAREKAGGETDDDDDDDEDDGSPFGMMLRAMKAARRAREEHGEAEPAAKPALSEEEIAAALAEDEKELL